MAAVEIKDKGLAKIMKALSGKTVTAKVGIQGSEAMGDHDGITNVALGVVHEFGAPAEGIPARSFLRSTMDEKRDRYFRMMLKGTRQVVDTRGVVDVERVMGLVAEAAAADVKKKINSNIPPPLSEKYRKKREAAGKGSRTLVVDGQLRNSITPKVESK